MCSIQGASCRTSLAARQHWSKTLILLRISHYKRERHQLFEGVLQEAPGYNRIVTNGALGILSTLANKDNKYALILDVVPKLILSTDSFDILRSHDGREDEESFTYVQRYGGNRPIYEPIVDSYYGPIYIPAHAGNPLCLDFGVNCLNDIGNAAFLSTSSEDKIAMD